MLTQQAQRPRPLAYRVPTTPLQHHLMHLLVLMQTLAIMWLRRAVPLRPLHQQGIMLIQPHQLDRHPVWQELTIQQLQLRHQQPAKRQIQVTKLPIQEWDSRLLVHRVRTNQIRVKPRVWTPLQDTMWVVQAL